MSEHPLPPRRAALGTLGGATLAMMLPACALTAGDSRLTVKGTATYRERMALPPGATLEASVADVSLADAPAVVLGQTRSVLTGAPPFSFVVPVDAARMNARGRYALQIRISQGEQLLFITDQFHAVEPRAGVQQFNVVLQRVAPAPVAATGATTLPLEGTHWKLVAIQGKPLPPRAPNSLGNEAHLTLHPQDQRISGSGGCNGLMGSYKLAGASLSFGQIAGTLRMCVDTMDTERRFLDMLSAVRAWEAQGTHLKLKDASGATLAEFEAASPR